MVLLMLDVPEKNWDTQVSTFLLKQALGMQKAVEGDEFESEQWSVTSLQQYVALLRGGAIQPQQSLPAQRLIVSFLS